MQNSDNFQYLGLHLCEPWKSLTDDAKVQTGFHMRNFSVCSDSDRLAEEWSTLETNLSLSLPVSLRRISLAHRSINKRAHRELLAASSIPRSVRSVHQER